MPMPDISVVVPAHNEESVISRTLTALVSDARPGEAEIIVVCNGCTDATPEVVRQLAMPGVTLTEIVETSKTTALNVGDGLAGAFPRFYLDADITVSMSVLRAMADRLRSGELLAVSASTSHVVASGSRAVRSYYAIWSRLPAASTGLAGTGIIGMSAAGRARFDRWPALLADDKYADSLFAPNESARHGRGLVELAAPTSARALIERRARVHNGNVQVRATGAPPSATKAQGAGLRGLLRAQPALVVHVPAFIAVTAAARMLAYADRRSGRASIWRRDDSRAQAQNPTTP